jgi:hypothetical protein
VQAAGGVSATSCSARPPARLPSYFASDSACISKSSSYAHSSSQPPEPGSPGLADTNLKFKTQNYTNTRSGQIGGQPTYVESLQSKNSNLKQNIKFISATCQFLLFCSLLPCLPFSSLLAYVARAQFTSANST